MHGSELSDKLSGYIVAFATTVSVLAFGGVEALGFAPAQVSILLLAGFVFWREGLPQLTMLTKIVLIAVLMVPLVQLVPLPVSFVESLSEFRKSLNAALRDAGVAVGSTQAISVYPHYTYLALLRLVTYLLVFLLAVRNYQRVRGQPALRSLLVFLGLFEACYGILQYLTAFKYIFFYQKAEPFMVATGTYINPNHFAGFLEICLPFVVAATLNYSGLDFRGGKGRWRRLLLAPKSSLFLLYTAVFCVVFVGLLASLSRSGIGGGLLGIAVASAIIARGNRRSVAVILIAIFLFAAVFSSWIGMDPLIMRFESLGAGAKDSEVRLAIWRDTLRLIRDSPLLGTGLGTYIWSSLHYQSSWFSFRYEHAHNDLLETAADMGIPAAVILWSALGTIFVRLVRKCSNLAHSSDRVAAAGCSGAIAALMLHSLTDFNLQIPANALLFSWIVGTGTALVQRPTAPTFPEKAVIEVSAEPSVDRSDRLSRNAMAE
jgi:O-antigen ligase